MKNLITYLSICTAFIACNQNRTQDDSTTGINYNDTAQTAERSTTRLEKVWETDTLMTTSESVLYDKERDLIYVSNINGGPAEEDGNGFISAVNLDGEVVDQYFFSGYLDAPKGMGLRGDKLYVTDIDELVEIDVNTKVSTNKWKIDTAKFLNDVAVSDDGTVYFSDSRANTIYSLEDSEVTVFLHDENLNGPNGLLVNDSIMMVATMNGSKLLKINMNDKSNLEVMTEEIGAGDGVVAVGDGSFLVSSWNGEVFFIDEQGNKQSILNTRGDEINSADIEYIQEEDLLLVPTFFDNRIVAYKLNRNNSDNSADEPGRSNEL
jgi:outer membrane protein assembly factor BamB